MAFFLQLANDIVVSGQWPEAFKQSTTVIIPKPKKEDYSKAKSYRPIALLECPGKLISKLIANRLQSDISIYDIAHPLQFGGRKHHATLDAGLYITEFITKARNAGLYTTALALDAAQFFPSLNKEIIVKILLKEGFNPIICRLFETYYDDRSTKYLWNQHFSRDYDVNNGVPQGDPLSPIISVIYMSAMLHKLFPFRHDQPTHCLSYIDDFVLLTASPRLEDNVDRLENDFIRLSRAFNALGVTIEASKTELMHFAAKQPQTGRGRRPLRFNVIHSLLPNIELHPTRRNTPTYIIPPSKEWRYLGFYFDPFLSFSSHCKRYAAKALVSANNLKILGHSLGGVDPALRRHVYQAVVWSVLSYGLPLWYRLDGKGCKAHLKLFNKTQNVALRWISGAFRTTPIPWMEYLTGIPPVRQKANYMLRNALQRVSRVPHNHILNHLAVAPVVHQLRGHRQAQRPSADNIWQLQAAAKEISPLHLRDPITRIGNRLLDSTTRVKITIPAAPPRASKVFEQWAVGWMCRCRDDLPGKTVIGSDGSYKIKGKGVSAFIVQRNGQTIHSSSFLVIAHSSYDAEMQAVHAAIKFVAHNVAGSVLVFVDNQATLKSLFNTRPHSAFELARENCRLMGDWTNSSHDNNIEFRWMPSHLGFEINELADKAADVTPIGPPPFPSHTIASRIRHNRSLVIFEWRQAWSMFANNKVLKLKKKKKPLLPNAWDGKGKQFISMAGDMITFSRFTRLVSGHAPTGEFRLRFFPHEPRGCTCFERFQSRSHLLTECPKYSFLFSSMASFHLANDNTKKIFRFLKENPTAFTFDDEPIDIYEPP